MVGATNVYDIKTKILFNIITVKEIKIGELDQMDKNGGGGQRTCWKSESKRRP